MTREDRLAAALDRGASGELPANVALMLAAFEALDIGELDAALATAHASADAAGARRVGDMQGLLQAHPQSFGLIKRVIATIDHGPAGGDSQATSQRIAKMFDAAVAISPEASVALYSLGNPDLLAQATADIVGSMEQAGLLGPERRLLDIGCGIGRIETALANRVGTITGIDVSAGMIAEAERRAGSLPGVSFAVSSGRDLAPFSDGSFDTVVAVDSFPYVVEAGLAEAMLGEMARVLRPGGALMIFNYSYRGDADRDLHELSAMAAALGLSSPRAGRVPGSLWDGRSFLLQKPPFETDPQ